MPLSRVVTYSFPTTLRSEKLCLTMQAQIAKLPSAGYGKPKRGEEEAVKRKNKHFYYLYG
jgi:hypothetical protein